jgi:hypothetical protein
VAQAIDTFGVQTGGFTVFQNTLGRGVGGESMFLPNGKVAFRAVWSEETINGVYYPSGTKIGILDTATLQQIWSREILTPTVSNITIGYTGLVGANADGSLLVNNKTDNRNINLERFSSSGVLQTSWPLAGGDYNILSINQSVYLGNDKAYLVGRASSRTVPRSRPCYWTTYIDGTGDPFNPTAITGPREPIAWGQTNIYPNPTTDFLTVETEQKLQYQVVSGTGSVVQAGTTTRQNPVAVASLPSGIYILRLTDGKRSLSKRFVKE